MKLILAFILSMPSAHAVYLSSCHNYASTTKPVSYSYESCVNSNFNTITRTLRGLYFARCSNYSYRTVKYSYTSCINQNFRTVASKLNRPYLYTCNNFNDDELSYSFTNCVNDNFRSITRELDNR